MRRWIKVGFFFALAAMILFDAACISPAPAVTSSDDPVSSPTRGMAIVADPTSRPTPATAGAGLPVSSPTPGMSRVDDPAGSPTPGITGAGDPVLVGAGDIASCNSSGHEATARLLDDIPGTVFTLGDNAYQSGTADEYANCYDPSWGRHKDQTRPAAGNHDYSTPGADGYFDYFGAAAGPPGKGYYSYDLGAWHVIVLNSNCEDISGGCHE